MALATRWAAWNFARCRNNLVHHPYEKNGSQSVRNSPEPEIGRDQPSHALFGESGRSQFNLHRYLNRDRRYPNEDLESDGDPNRPKRNRCRSISQHRDRQQALSHRPLRREACASIARDASSPSGGRQSGPVSRAVATGQARPGAKDSAPPFGRIRRETSRRDEPCLPAYPRGLPR